MQHAPMQQPQSPTLLYASRAGIVFGLYFAIKYLALMYMIPHPGLSLAFLLGTLFVPFLAYRLTKSYREIIAPVGDFSFRDGWVFGVLIYLFASIVVLIPHYIFYTRLLPEQFPILAEKLSEIYAQLPEIYQQHQLLLGGEPLEIMTEQMQQLPVGRMLVADVLNNVFLGSLLSLINAALLRRKA